jgi:hypothetical protein
VSLAGAPRLSPAFSCALLSTPKLTSFLPHAVPGSSQRFLDKSRSLAADCVAYDLEDSVTPHMKAEARGLVRRAIDQPTPSGIRERAVRINSVDSGLALGDLTEVVRIDPYQPIQQPNSEQERKTHANTITTTAPIAKPNNNRDPKGQLSLRPDIRNGRHLPHPRTTAPNRKQAANLLTRPRRVRQVPHQPHPNLRRLAFTPGPCFRCGGLRSGLEYYAYARSSGIPLRAFGYRDRGPRSRAPIDN